MAKEAKVGLSGSPLYRTKKQLTLSFLETYLFLTSKNRTTPIDNKGVACAGF